MNLAMFGQFPGQVDGRSVATPLFLCLLVIEFSDIVFATDSVPAVLGTTQEPSETPRFRAVFDGNRRLSTAFRAKNQGFGRR